MDNKKMAALGSKRELLPLKSLGFALFDCKNLEEAEALIEKLSAQKYELVVISENIVEGNQNLFLKMVKSFPPAILVLPQYKIRRNFAKNIVKEIIKEAVGF
jgi:vacuolar-type H+-ATPase subunit F/Vma7